MDSVRPEFEFVLEEYGWAHMHVRFGEQAYTIERISYCTEALHDLLFAGLEVSFGHREAKVTFDHEGWGSELRFTKEWVSRPEADEDGACADERWRVELVTDARCEGVEPERVSAFISDSRDTIGKALLIAGQRVWEELGPAEYDRRWISNGFPNRALVALQAALAANACLGQRRFD